MPAHSHFRNNRRSEKPPTSKGRIGEDFVRQLATKMTGAHGAEPPPLRSLVVGSLHGQEPPMNGLQLPVMVGTPGVSFDSKHLALTVSQIPQQAMWVRWAAGDLSTSDRATAAAWRAGIEATDLDIERERWKPIAHQLGNPTTMKDVVDGIDRVISDGNPTTQKDLIDIALRVVRGTDLERTSAIAYFCTRHVGATIGEYAPFTTHVARLYMSFAVDMACNLLGTRRSNAIDLEYLLYAPFCRVFVSNDNLHRNLWEAGAVTSHGSFVWGEHFRADLKQRNDRRVAMTHDEWAEHRRVHGQWPEPIEGSIVSALWERHCPNWPRGGDVSPNVGKTIDELDDRTCRTC